MQMALTAQHPNSHRSELEAEPRCPGSSLSPPIPAPPFLQHHSIKHVCLEHPEKDKTSHRCRNQDLDPSEWWQPWGAFWAVGHLPPGVWRGEKTHMRECKTSGWAGALCRGAGQRLCTEEWWEEGAYRDPLHQARDTACVCVRGGEGGENRGLRAGRRVLATLRGLH